MLQRSAGTGHPPHRAGQCANASCHQLCLFAPSRSTQCRGSHHLKPALIWRPPHVVTSYDTVGYSAAASGGITRWTVRRTAVGNLAATHRAAMADEVEVSTAMEALAQDAIVWATQHGLVRMTLDRDPCGWVLLQRVQQRWRRPSLHIKGLMSCCVSWRTWQACLIGWQAMTSRPWQCAALGEVYLHRQHVQRPADLIACNGNHDRWRTCTSAGCRGWPRLARGCSSPCADCGATDAVPSRQLR